MNLSLERISDMMLVKAAYIPGAEETVDSRDLVEARRPFRVSDSRPTDRSTNLTIASPLVGSNLPSVTALYLKAPYISFAPICVAIVWNVVKGLTAVESSFLIDEEVESVSFRKSTSIVDWEYRPPSVTISAV